MLSIGKLVASQAAYYTEQLTHSLGEDTPVQKPDGSNQTDYYTSHQAPSRWIGSGLDRLGLERGSAVDDGVFEQLMNHRSPAGEEMILPRAGRLTVAAFDLTLSAPKSVSLLYAFGKEEVHTKVIDAHRDAVAEAITYMEQQASQTRVVERRMGEDGISRMETRTVGTEGFVAAGFDHFTSRAQDPQLHIHVVAINRVWAERGWRALDSQRAYAHAKAGGTIYEVKLREGLTYRLGVQWGLVTNGIADIEGFSPELIRHFSDRKTEIDQAVERHLAKHGGVRNRRMTQAFTLETRQAKVHLNEQSPHVRRMKDYGVVNGVESHWYQKAIDAPEDVISLVEKTVTWPRYGVRPTDAQLVHAANTMIESMVRKQSVFSERHLLCDVAAHFPEGASAQELTAAAKLVLEAGQAAGAVISVIPERQGPVTLPPGIHLDQGEMKLVVADCRDAPPSDRFLHLRVLPGEPRFTTRTQLEREALVLDAVHVSSSVRVDRVALEHAILGHRLAEEQAAAIRHLSQLDGRLVLMVGPGGSGKTQAIGAYAEALRSAGNWVIGAATSATAAAQLGQNLDGCWAGTIALLRHHLETSGQSLPKGTVLLIDEASMVSTYDLAWATQLIHDCDGKLVLIGDPRQLPSVDSGGLFHRLAAHGDQVVDELASVNQRQNLDLDRENLTRLRSGKIAEAMHHYSEAGRLHLGKSESSTKSAMVEAWWRDVERLGLEQVRMLASRRQEVEMLNQLARVEMSQAGLLTGPILTNRWGIEFQAGDRVVVRDKDPDRGSASFRRDVDGRLIELPRSYVDRSLDLAYAQTIHTAQGQTFEVTHLYVDLGVQAEHGYTALSRARGETHLWLNDARGPLGYCTHLHGDPLIEDRIDVLVRQLTESVVEPPAHDQGIALQAVGDRELVEAKDQLEVMIRKAPISADLDDQIVAFDTAITEGLAIYSRSATTGAEAQLRHLEGKRDELVEQRSLQQVWLAENVESLRHYLAISEELHHRLGARLASYSLDPPDDLVAAIGPRPNDDIRKNQWCEIARLHAKYRLELGSTAELLDPTLETCFLYRDAVANFTRPAMTRGSPTLALQPVG